MKLFLGIIAILFIQMSFGQDSTFVRGNNAYANGDFETALVEYNKIVGSEKLSSQLFYNLGNTYYRLDELGEAIWAYESALKIDPGNENTRFNLKFVNATTYDELDSSDSGIMKWLEINLFSFSLNFWSFVSIILSFILAFTLYFFFTTKKQKVKNTSLTVAFGSFFLVAASVIFAGINKSKIIHKTEAIIVTEAIEIRTSPSETAPEAFKLHEGTKVDLLRSNENWTEINVNGNTGWVQKQTLWEI